MRQFKDAHGRDWTVHLTVSEAEKVLAVGCDIYALLSEDGATLRALTLNPRVRADVLNVLVGSDGDRPVLDGDAIDRGIQVVIDEAIDFFPLALRDSLRVALVQMMAGMQGALAELKSASWSGTT